MTEQHERQFRGIWLPPEIVTDVADGILDPIDLVILTLTEAKAGIGVKNYRPVARLVGETVSRISHRVQELAASGLLVRQDGGFRTCWSPPRTPKGGGR